MLHFKKYLLASDIRHYFYKLKKEYRRLQTQNAKHSYRQRFVTTKGVGVGWGLQAGEWF